jgi:hypothetical protein
MTEVYSDYGRTSFKYQYSVGVALHGTDVAGYIRPAAINQSPSFSKAFMEIWGMLIQYIADVIRSSNLLFWH